MQERNGVRADEKMDEPFISSLTGLDSVPSFTAYK